MIIETALPFDDTNNNANHSLRGVFASHPTLPLCIENAPSR
jgi:hypothetical protein